MMRHANAIVLVLSMCVLLTAQSGGPYDLKDSVIANGGGTSAAGVYDITGTVGQNLATGVPAIVGGVYSHTAGFWNTELAPTAAGVSITGRVLTAGGDPLYRVRITLIGPVGPARATVSNVFGYYRFDDVEVGTAYLLQATAREFQFAPRVVMVVDEVTGLDIIAK